MLKNLSAGWFTKAPPKEPLRRIKLEPELRTLLDKTQVRDSYKSLLKQMSTLTMRKNQVLLQEVKHELLAKNVPKALEHWTRITSGFGSGYYPNFDELYRKHPKPEWQRAEEVLKLVGELPAADAAQFFTQRGFMNIFVALKLLENMAPEQGLAYIKELGARSTEANHFVALNCAANRWLRQQGMSTSSLQALFENLPERFRLRLFQYNTSTLATLHRRHMLAIWDLLYDNNAKLNTPGMSSFLRALLSSSDAGNQKVLEALRTRDFSLGFYHYLVNVLCRRKDRENVDWIFENKLENSRADLILYSLLVRTLTFDGFEDAKPVLEAMGDNVPEQSWKAIFREFRKRGEVEKAFESLRRAVAVFDLKLSFVLVNDYLLMVSQNFKPEVFFKSLLAVFPQYEHTLKVFNVLPDPSIAAEPTFMLHKSNLGFEQKEMHESTLALVYQVVLNTQFDIDAVVALFKVYMDQTIASGRRVTLGVTDVFVAALMKINTRESHSTAQQAYKLALENLPLRKPADAYFGNKSLHALVSSLCKSGEAQAAIKLVDLSANHPHVPLRGKALRRLFMESGESPEFKEWARQNGAFVEKS